MKKFFFSFAAMLLAVAMNAAVINIDNSTPDALRIALANAASGDEIVMAAGIYEESAADYLAFTGKEVIVRAAEGAEVIVKPTAPVRLKEGAKAEFVNIKFDCSGVGSYDYVIVAADDTDNKRVVLNGCEFYGWDKNKAMIEATSSRRLAEVTINNCYFHDCMKSVVFIENTGSIALNITNSTFANIATNAESFWAGVIDSRAENGSVLVDHCTFYNVLAMNTDYAAIGKIKTPGAVVSNSIFMLPASTDGVRAIRDVAQANNCLTFNYLKDSGTGIHSDVAKTNCIQQDPLFVDAANGNFKLGEGSPALTLNDGQPIGDPRWNAAPAIEPGEPKAIYLKPTIWAADNAKFGVYAFRDGLPEYFSEVMALAEDETEIYTATIPENYTGVVFIRLNNGADHVAWDQLWNQTVDLTIPEGMDMFTITGWGDNKSVGDWSKYEKTEPVDMGPVVYTYFATGENWEEDTESKVVWDAEAQSITVNIAKDKVTRWQAQVMVQGPVAQAGKIYDFSCKLQSNVTVAKNTIKYQGDVALFNDTAVILEAGVPLTYAQVDLVGMDGGNGQIVFDFGYALAGTVITISEINFVERDAPVVADGFYLIGRIGGVDGWDIAALRPENKFQMNPANDAEFMLEVTLTVGDEIQVVNVYNNAITDWYPGGEGNNYIIDEKHAGAKTIYFRPDRQGGEGWHLGCIYIQPNEEQGLNRTDASVKAIKIIRNGQILINKNGKFYNALGAEVE